MKFVPIISSVNGIVIDVNNDTITINISSNNDHIVHYPIPEISTNIDNVHYINIVSVNDKLEKGKTILGYTYQVDDDKYPIINNLINKLSINQVKKLIAEYNNENVNVKQLIILTTPHEVCKGTDHDCDKYAISLAEQLNKSLPEKNNEREISLFHGDINRNTIDLNRFPGRFTEFRHNVRMKVISQLNKLMEIDKTATDKNKIIFIIDCHSFRSKSSYENIRTSNPDVAILFKCNDLLIVEELMDILKDNGVVTIKFIGTRDDIIDEYEGMNNYFELHEHNIRIIPVLIEVNEALSDEKIMVIGKCVNEWINKVNNYLTTKFKKMKHV